MTGAAYRLTLVEHASYLHAIVTGERTPQNAARFLKEVHEACARTGTWSVLLEMRFDGPSLETAAIYEVISRASPAGASLRRIAYVDPTASDPGKPRFAETVAVNRGVNVRLFPDAAAAAAWLEAGD